MEDLQILRYAALEIQANQGNLVRIAGIVQKIKNWWESRKNRQAFQEVRGPIDKSFDDLQKAIQSHDAEAVDRITSDELPRLLTKSVKELSELRDNMLSHETEYVGKGGEILSGNNLGWVAKNYQKEQTLVEKLWDSLPVEFRSEIPVGKRINQPINSFSWYKQYNSEDIRITENVKQNLWNSFTKTFNSDVIARMQPGYEQFLDNLRFGILNNSILVQVNFSPVSQQVQKRYSNEMRVELSISDINYPIDNIEVPIKIDKIILTDLGTRISVKSKILSVLGVWLSPINKSLKIPSVTASEGPLTKIVKKALLKDLLPNTKSIVKVFGIDLDYNIQFARILASALRQEIDAECSVCSDGNGIEIQANVNGSKTIALSAIFGISKYIAEEFFKNTNYIVDTDVIAGESELEPVTSELFDSSFRKVALDNWSMKCLKI